MLRKFLRRESAAPFAEPVPLDLVPGYAEAIVRPADLGTVLATLQREQYPTLGARWLALLPTSQLSASQLVA